MIRLDSRLRGNERKECVDSNGLCCSARREPWRGVLTRTTPYPRRSSGSARISAQNTLYLDFGA